MSINEIADILFIIATSIALCILIYSIYWLILNRKLMREILNNASNIKEILEKVFYE